MGAAMVIGILYGRPYGRSWRYCTSVSKTGPAGRGTAFRTPRSMSHLNSTTISEWGKR